MESIVGILTAMHKQMQEKHLPMDPESLPDSIPPLVSLSARSPVRDSTPATLPEPNLNSSIVLESIKALELVGPEPGTAPESANLEAVAAPEPAVPETAATKTIPEQLPAEWMIVSSPAVMKYSGITK